MTHLRHFILGTALALLVTVSVTPQPAHADNDAIWGAVGGLMAGKLLSDHQQKKQSEAYQQGAQDQYIAQQQQYSQQQQQAAASPEQRLARLKNLKDQGLISESDYNTQKAAIVSTL